MALLSRFPKLGQLSVYDTRKELNFKTLVSDFDKLVVDPYVKEGYRKKHILRAKYTKNGLEKVPLRPLFQSKDTNPTHGNIIRIYPEVVSDSPDTIDNILHLFIKLTNMPLNETILFQEQRVQCDNMLTGLPSVENWHKDSVSKVGIICVSRENIVGGINQFRVNNDQANVLSKVLLPGFMAVFEDDQIQHRVTPIRPLDKSKQGYRDVILLAYGNGI
jgi:hypothetical protein